MFFELRTYDLAPGKAPVYLDFFRSYGAARVTRHLPMVGYWMAESGRLNRIEHLWAYESFAERDACRASLAGDTEWTEGFVPKAFADIVAQENRFLRLDESSSVFDAAISARKVQARQTETLFAPTLHGLSHGSALSGAGTLIAGFTVLSGANPGALVTLSAGDFATLSEPQPGIVSHEILRPLSLSPLR